MDTSGLAWKKWRAPYDPRQVDGTIITEDEHGRMVETADCGLRCPGCGVCCLEYRDCLSEDYQGVQEFELNLKAIGQQGGIVQIGENWVYRGAQCDQRCPGYGQCCQPYQLRAHPSSVEHAREMLFERDDSTLFEIREALLLLAHEGTDEATVVLERYLPIAHTRVVGFAECALDEGRFFNSSPRSDEERVKMLKREVLERYEDLICEAQAEIDEIVLPEIERLEYELEIVLQVKDRDDRKPEEMDWQAQVDVLEMLLGNQQGRLAELQADMERNEAILAEIERDLAAS